ncbi:MAG TPA: winged helix-turn-helix domain-containing protein [Candidatus Nitrosotenuis sp.]|nr:winged helix-turn-helix domain-containing protein [Candidatus Nitrosotenuis sp.]
MIERKRLESNGKEDIFLSILGDKFSRQILGCIVDRPKTASEISAECGILLSMVYRRLQFLEEANVLSVTGMIGKDGKKRFAYQSKISGISASFDKNTIVATVKPSIITQEELRT